ncbi:hypothetical protein [Natrinema sp. SYSU A 869]|uniref:hypothetical protein n=1 Tax=Natrinema sp. SYSU A 869 TaxID=2871694 RepID=UPI001CA40332|nr:hypothetical protein [Natrinema sp. SYSU A 869]
MQNGNSGGSTGEDGEKKLVMIATVDEGPEDCVDEFIESNAAPGNRITILGENDQLESTYTFQGK